MKKIVIRSYSTGKVLKKISYPIERSVTYGVEGDRFVIRDYHTNKKIKSVAAPLMSITFTVEGE